MVAAPLTGENSGIILQIWPKYHSSSPLNYLYYTSFSLKQLELVPFLEKESSYRNLH